MSVHHRLQVQTESLTHQILDMVERLPKKQQFLFGRRLSNLVVDALEVEIQAQQAKEGRQVALLQTIETIWLRIRVLLRICADRKLISLGQLAQLTEKMMICEELLEQWKQYLVH